MQEDHQRHDQSFQRNEGRREPTQEAVVEHPLSSNDSTTLQRHSTGISREWPHWNSREALIGESQEMNALGLRRSSHWVSRKELTGSKGSSYGNSRRIDHKGCKKFSSVFVRSMRLNYLPMLSRLRRELCRIKMTFWICIIQMYAARWHMAKRHLTRPPYQPLQRHRTQETLRKV